MAYFNEDNVTEQMCIAVAKDFGANICISYTFCVILHAKLRWIAIKIKNSLLSD